MSPSRLFPARPLLAALALAATPLLAACDFSDDDGDNNVGFGNDVIVETFTVEGEDFDVSDDGTVGSYQLDVPDLDEDVAEGGAVLLYAGDEIFFGSPQGTWTALPTSLGYDEDGDGLVDITVSYTFSYDIEDLYIDVIASSPIEFQDTDFRLVLIPGEFFDGNARRGVDFSDYEAVRQAFALPE